MNEQNQETQEQVEVETVNVTIAVGKESKEVADCLAEIVEDIRAGKKLEAVAENLPGLMTAIDGYDKLDDEQKHDSKHGTRAYISMKLSQAIDTKIEKVAE